MSLVCSSAYLFIYFSFQSPTAQAGPVVTWPSMSSIFVTENLMMRDGIAIVITIIVANTINNANTPDFYQLFETLTTHPIPIQYGCQCPTGTFQKEYHQVRAISSANNPSGTQK